MRLRTALDVVRAIALVVSVVLLVFVWSRLAADEHKTCLIQQRGLPAAREQQQSMVYLFRLLEDKPSRLQRVRQPPPTREQARDLRELRRHLGALARLESGQPASRGCG